LAPRAIQESLFGDSSPAFLPLTRRL